MCKILVITPYVGLKDLVLEVNKELKKDLDVYVGNLYDGLAIAKSLEHRNYDVIVSRGATAKLLQKHISIPVVEIQLTGYDILRTLTLLNGYSGKIAMMSYLNLIPGANAIGELLNMDITFYPINEEKEIEGNIKRASAEGVQIIIGDVISTKTAAEYGIQAILITSGKEAIIETIANVEHMVYYTQQQKNELNNIKRIFTYVEEGVIVFNGDETCVYLNDKAKKYFHFIEEIEALSLEKLLHIAPPLEGLFSKEHGESPASVEINMQGETYRSLVVPLDGEGLDQGFALLLKVQKSKKQIKRQDQRAYFHFNSLVAQADKMKKLVKIGERVSRSDLPVIIYGEPGVGKNSLAQAIHNKGDRQQEPYVFVNCEAYSESQLERELFGSNGDTIQIGVLEIANGGTLFIDAIGKLPLSLQGKLLQVIETKQMSRLHSTEKIHVDIRFIAAHRSPLEPLIQDGHFREDLYYVLNGFTLKVPPLRERMEDLDDLVRIVIAASNTTTGKQISGLRETVLEKLKTLSWPGNIQQLKHVVERMCLMSSGPFIEQSEVQPLLIRLAEADKERKQELHPFEIKNKTLQEIEQEVIQSVLKEEDYNQSRAAKRLGINRSTLWRKIKQIT